MSDRNWTEAQLEAIHKTRKNILVSAAAGSGKTSVLTKRIIEKITDKNNPTDISRMLVVTFTKSAAKELKERIAKAVKEEIAKNPSDKKLQRQYVLLQKAKISTIHGFCLNVIKKNFDKLGLSPSLSVSDQSQTSLMMQQVADILIDNYYSSLPGYSDIKDFPQFADNFISINDNKLSEILISVYNKIKSFPRGIEFLSDSASQLEKVSKEGIQGTVWGNLIFQHVYKIISYYKEVFSDACEILKEDEKYAKAYYNAFESDLNFAEELLNISRSCDTEKIRETINGHKKLKLGSLKKEFQNKDTDFYKSERTNFWKEINKINDSYFSQSNDTIKITASKTHDFVFKLYLFVKSFDNLFTLEKMKRELLDYNDLERLTYKLLIDESGSPTDTAISLSREFDEIYIDEYQDVNKLQDMIFSAISSESSRFMVGDIKQSIYGFRGAEPSLFADYRKNPQIIKVYLKHNFRSDKPIIDFVNLVCGTIFTNAGKTVPYDTNDELICGQTNTKNEKVEIDIIDTDDDKNKINIAKRRNAEADFAANRVSKLIKEGYSPGDICILLRVASGTALIYEEALKKFNIPCKNQLSNDLFINPEILLVMDLLNVIDNPSRDIYLTGTLKSPIFNFTLDELVTIRNFSKEGSLFQALKKYTEQNDFIKGKYFLNKLEQYRKISSEPVDKLIWDIYCDTNIFAFATGNNSSVSYTNKKTNLITLYDYARKFESGKFKGLYNFIRYINDLIDSGEQIPSPSDSAEAQKSVNIMSIHQSKGLEFPVILLCDSATKFNEKDTKDDILIDRDFATTMKLSDSTGLATYETVMRSAEAFGISEKNCDEEMRILYVALTRAKHKLIITGAVPNANELIENCSLVSTYSKNHCSYPYTKYNNFLSWILMSSNDKYIPTIIKLETADEEEFDNSDIKYPEPVSALVTDNNNANNENIKKLELEFRKRFDFKYEGLGYIIPVKLSVSELYPEILDDSMDSYRYSSEKKEKMKKPSFLLESASSAADRGTATHQFMEFCNFNMLEKYGIDNEINRLVDNGFINSQTSKLIEKKAINNFISTSLFSEMKCADFIRRELRFEVKFPASIFTSEKQLKESLKDESILVQGVIDCVFTDKNGVLTILDYKTDKTPHELLYSQEESEKYLIEKHYKQLLYYKLACEKMMCRPCNRLLIYSFYLNKAIKIPEKL